MGRKGENIFKRKDGRYEGRNIKEYVYGKPVYEYVYARTYEECKKKKAITFVKVESKPRKKKNYSKKLIILVDDWLNNKKNIKESTYTRYSYLINEHIRYDIGRTSMSKLNAKVINEYLESKLYNGKMNGKGGLSRNTIYDISNILRQVLKENKIDIEFIKISKKIGTSKSLYTKERELLFDNLFEDDSTIALGILLSLLMGLRIAEVCGLKFKDIDEENKIIRIERIISRVKSRGPRVKTRLMLNTPKTENSKRIIPIPTKIYDKILYLKKTMLGVTFS